MVAVFKANFKKAEKQLQKLGESMDFVYSTIHHSHQTMGKSRKKAEQAFMENVIDPEEREAFTREIEEAVAKRLQEMESDSGVVWVDHSDISDQE
jgi:hypothetical protein